MRRTSLSPPFLLVYCYAPIDYPFLEKIEKHLSPWKRSGLLQTWDQQRIPLGTDLKHEIDSHLMSADIIILLVSADFLASDDCTDQAETALERYKKEHIVVVPVLVRHVDWHNSPIDQLKSFLPNETPINAWEDPDEAYSIVAQKIYEFACILLDYKRERRMKQK